MLVVKPARPYRSGLADDPPRSTPHRGVDRCPEAPQNCSEFVIKTGKRLVHTSLHGVLDVFVLFDLDVFNVTADLLDFANVDRVDDVAGVWID
jgi:hypothetical protein